MKKILRNLFSLAAIVALTSTPIYAAQKAEKVSSKLQVERPTITTKVEKAPEEISQPTRSSFEDKFNARSEWDNSFFKIKNEKSTRPVFDFGIKSPSKSNVLKAEGNYPEIYGSVISSNPKLSTGVYQIPTTSGVEGFVKKFSTEYPAIYGGTVCNGIYYCNTFYQLSIMKYYYILGYDIESGEMVYNYKASNTRNYYSPSGMATDPITGKVYGIFYNASANALDLAEMTYPESGSAAPVKTIIKAYDSSVVFAAFAIDKQGQFYGIKQSSTGEGILCKIDRNTGAIEEIGGTGYYPYDISGAVIDPRSNRMFWTVSPADGTGLLTEVDLSTGETSLITYYDNNAEITGLYVAVPEAEDGAPDYMTNVNFNFSQDSLTGTVTASAPSKTFDGSSLTSDLSVFVTANGQVVGSKTGVTPGSDVTVDVTVPEAGLYTFQVYASNDEGEGPKYRMTDVWIGADTPSATEATAEYVNGNMEISWNAVTAGINGGYLDLENLSYTIKDANDELVAQGLTETSYSFVLPEPENITVYTYTVYVVCNGLTSEGAVTNPVTLGAITPPYVADFANTGLDGWTIINVGDDKRMWTLLADGTMRMEYLSSTVGMDDWLVTPPVRLKAGSSYEVSFNVSCESAEYPEKIEVKWGKDNTVEGLTNQLLEPTIVTEEKNYGGKTYTQLLVPQEDGVYYIGWHAMSDPDTYFLYLKDIQIAVGSSSEVPGLPSNLTLTPGEGGSLTCAITFNAPDKTIGDNALQSLDRVELYREETLIHTFTSPAPGAALSYTDNLEVGGEVTYTVVGYNEAGEGLKATDSVLVGFDLPLASEYCEISRTDIEGQVLVTWAPVTQDVKGNTLGADDVTYIVCYDYNGTWRVQAMDVKGTSYTYQAVKAGNQDFVQCAVYAQTTAGIGDVSASSDMIPVGKPYAGLDETFADGDVHYLWGIERVGYFDYVLATDATFQDVKSVAGDNGFFGITADYIGMGGGLFSGLVSLNQMENAALTFYTYNLYNGEMLDPNTISVAVQDANSNEGWIELVPATTVNDLCGGNTDNWCKVTVPLTQFANKTIQIKITGIIQYYTYILLDDIKIGSILSHDLAITSISAPSLVTAGDDYSVDVIVANEGIDTAESYSVELYANEQIVATQQCSDLASGNIENVSFDLNMSPLATSSITYYAKINYTLDQNPDNNQSLNVTTTPEISTLPVATNLEAESYPEGVMLTWVEPNMENGMVITEDFEDATSFSNKYGDWTFIDLDKGVVGGMSTGNLPGITPGVTTGSFWIWDCTDNVASNVGSSEAHSGIKYLFSIYNDDGSQVDDWAISPKLSAGPQTISFYAKSYSASYPEEMQVLWTSEETINEANFQASWFTVVEGSTISPVPATWTLYQYTLPAEATYFAIRSFAEDAFMLFIDDVSFNPIGSTDHLQVEGYNVFRNGEKVNDQIIEEAEFLDTTVEDGNQYSYLVTVVYKGEGESAPSNEAVILYKSSGIEAAVVSPNIYVEDQRIIVENAFGNEVVVSAINGVVVYNSQGEARNEVNVEKGVYIVKVGKLVKKVLVK